MKHLGERTIGSFTETIDTCLPHTRCVMAHIRSRNGLIADDTIVFGRPEKR